MPRMIADAETYFSTLTDVATDMVAEEMYSQAARSGVPVIGPVMGRLLEILARLSGAKQILELGSATGYSTLFLARAARSNAGHILGVDMNPSHCKTARKVLGSAGMHEWCTILCADARNLPLPSERFDMLFLDVDQRYYAELEDVCHRLLRPGGFMVADNTAFDDARGFNTLIQDASRWMSTNLLSFLPRHAPERDGLCVAIKI